MNYAKNLLAKNYPLGVLMIDNQWGAYHGNLILTETLFLLPEQ